MPPIIQYHCRPALRVSSLFVVSQSLGPIGSPLYHHWYWCLSNLDTCPTRTVWDHVFVVVDPMSCDFCIPPRPRQFSICHANVDNTGYVLVEVQPRPYPLPRHHDHGHWEHYWKKLDRDPLLNCIVDVVVPPWSTPDDQ